MGPEDLETILRFLPETTDPNLLAGRHDDAVVYRLGEDLALVQSVDFITPVVNDPYYFGAIAAANALSDLYAMGARPILGLNLVSYPVRTLPLGILGEILRGAGDKAQEAGVSLAGGHSVDDPTPKFGLAVTGLIDPRAVVTKAGAHPGDRLVLTKPLGIGALTTGIDRGVVDQRAEAEVSRVMAQLNRAASEVMLRVGVNAATDVTGYGLLGHLREMLLGSGCAASLELSAIPVLPGAWEALRADAVSSGTLNNVRFYGEKVEWGKDFPKETKILLSDAQTSGGLLLAVAEEKAPLLVRELLAAGTLTAAVVGRVLAGPAGGIQVEA